jgi:hypothetical protein
VHRRAGENPADLPRTRTYCGEQISRPCAPLLQLLGFYDNSRPPCRSDAVVETVGVTTSLASRLPP